MEVCSYVGLHDYTGIAYYAQVVTADEAVSGVSKNQTVNDAIVHELAQNTQLCR